MSYFSVLQSVLESTVHVFEKETVDGKQKRANVGFYWIVCKKTEIIKCYLSKKRFLLPLKLNFWYFPVKLPYIIFQSKFNTLKKIFKDFIYLFLERKGGREGEKH